MNYKIRVDGEKWIALLGYEIKALGRLKTEGRKTCVVACLGVVKGHVRWCGLQSEEEDAEKRDGCLSVRDEFSLEALPKVKVERKGCDVVSEYSVWVTDRRACRKR